MKKTIEKTVEYYKKGERCVVDKTRAAVTWLGDKFSGWFGRKAKREGANVDDIVDVETGKVRTLADDISEWLGAEDVRVITNESGDKIFLSADGTKRVRFDFNNPSPHNNPHSHIEQLIDDKWRKSVPIYPIDVPHN